jgi:hypothetical protein
MNKGQGFNISEGGFGGNTKAGYTEEELNSFKEKSSKLKSPEIMGIENYNKWRKRISKSQKGKKLSDEIKKKQSKALKGRVFSLEHRRKIGEKNKGKQHSEEFRQNLSKIMKEKYSNGKAPFTGKHHTEENKKRLSEIRKEKYTGKNHPSCIPIVVIKDNEVKEFSYINEAATYFLDKIDLSFESIRKGFAKMCKGTWSPPKTSKLYGYSAMYLEDYKKLNKRQA